MGYFRQMVSHFSTGTAALFGRRLQAVEANSSHSHPMGMEQK
jgi:hypothetical protein